MKEDKQEKYIKYVLQELVDNTVVDIRDQKIWHPYDEHYSRHLIGGAPYQFFDFVHDSYGIFPQEVESLWSQYKHRIRRENGWVQIYPFDSRGEAVRFAMSESRKHNKGNHEFKRIDNPKQHKFYNSIGDKVVSLIEVREVTGDRYDGMVEEIFLTDLLNPKYPRQGMSLPPNINISDYETFQARMLNRISDFFPMLEHYWSIDDIFSQIFILTRFVFPKIWNNFYKSEDQPEESTEYGEHALDYEEKMGKEKINESISLIDVVVKDMIKNTTTEVSEFSTRTVYVPTNNAIYNFDLLHNLEGCPNYLSNYIRDTYGLTTEEIEEVWIHYKEAIMNMLEDTDSNNPFAINESKKEDLYSFDWHPDPRKRKFYTSILKDVVKKSKIGWDGVIYVGDPVISHKEGLEFHNISHSYDTQPFMRHLKDTYGLLDNETHPIWSRWEHIMMDEMRTWFEGQGIPFTDSGYESGEEESPLDESTIKVDDETGELYDWKSNEQIDKEYSEKSKLQKGYLQWSVDKIINRIEDNPLPNKNPYRYGPPDSLPPVWIKLIWESLGLDQDEIDWSWRQVLKHFQPTELDESRSLISKNKFKEIFKDLHSKTVKLPETTKPLCTGGENPTLSDGTAVQIYFPSSDFPYYVELDNRVRYPFSNYLETTYHLNEDEIEEVWEKFRRYICHT